MKLQTKNTAENPNYTNKLFYLWRGSYCCTLQPNVLRFFRTHGKSISLADRENLSIVYNFICLFKISELVNMIRIKFKWDRSV